MDIDWWDIEGEIQTGGTNGDGYRLVGHRGRNTDWCHTDTNK